MRDSSTREKTMTEDNSAQFGKLEHVIVPIGTTPGFVLVLDTGAVIGPEAEAMLQALYSRDPGSVIEHLKKVAAEGAEKFMASFYVGYNHKSIGDCGTGTVFIEGVSMLAAKAIQDWMLYAGQEVSTRYVDFTHQAFVDPVGTLPAKVILDRLRSFYVESMEPLKVDLRLRYPKDPEESEKKYQNAIAARAFDILRGFLPSGASTSLAWHTNLRQAADKLILLRHHPLPEVALTAKALWEGLQKKYPSSFGHKEYELTEGYNRTWMQGDYLFIGRDAFPEFELSRDGIDRRQINVPEVARLFKDRPPKTELPKFLAELGTLSFEFLLDFGSFRDVQRQRSVIQRMPLVSTKFGFEDWYLNELPAPLRTKADLLLADTVADIAELSAVGVLPELLQYYVPMGYKIPNRLSGDLPALVYIAELRATPMVHPTLQKRAHQVAAALEDLFGQFGLKLYVSNEIGRFDTRRGSQTIEKREA